MCFSLILAFLLSIPAADAVLLPSPGNHLVAANPSFAPDGELKPTEPPSAAIGARLQEPSPALIRWLSSWRLKNERGRDSSSDSQFSTTTCKAPSATGAYLSSALHQSYVSAVASQQLYLLNRNLRL